LIFIPFSILGSAIGAYIFDVLKSIDINIFKLCFTIFLFFFGIKIYLKKDADIEADTEEIKIIKIEQLNKKIILLGLFGGLVAGTSSGLLGIGGGIVTVPYLTLVMGVSIHVAIGTSLFIMICTSISGVINHSLNGNLPIDAFFLGVFLAIGAVVGSNIGSRVAYRLKDKKIKKIYGIIMVAVAIPLIWLRVFLPSDPIQVFFNDLEYFFNNLIP
jgi:uncharacterized membrane protein YfcA